MEAVHKNIVVPEGYSIRYFGEKEIQDLNNEALAANLPLTFFLIFVTLLLLFRTYRKPVVIILMLPLIFIGVVLGLVVMGKTLDFFAILGDRGLESGLRPQGCDPRREEGIPCDSWAGQIGRAHV